MPMPMPMTLNVTTASQVHIHSLSPGEGGGGQRLLDFEMLNQELVWSTLARLLLVGRHFVPWKLLSSTVSRTLVFAKATLALPFDLWKRLVVLVLPRYVQQLLGISELGVDSVGASKTNANGNGNGEGIGQSKVKVALARELTRPCPICGDELAMAYVANCGHCFCYMCLRSSTRQQAGRFRCPRCDTAIESSERVRGDMLSSGNGKLGSAKTGSGASEGKGEGLPESKRK